MKILLALFFSIAFADKINNDVSRITVSDPSYSRPVAHDISPEATPFPNVPTGTTLGNFDINFFAPQTRSADLTCNLNIEAVCEFYCSLR